MNNTITFHAMTSIKEDGVLTINSWVECDIVGHQDIVNRVSTQIVNTQEKAIRDGLIALGWTPPTATF